MTSRRNLGHRRDATVTPGAPSRRNLGPRRDVTVTPHGTTVAHPGTTTAQPRASPAAPPDATVTPHGTTVAHPGTTAGSPPRHSRGTAEAPPGHHRSHFRPHCCVAGATAARALAPRGWPALSSLAWRRLAADALASFGLLPRGPVRPAASWLPSTGLGGSSPRTPSRSSWGALSSSHFRPHRSGAGASAARALAPRGWPAPSSLA